MTNHNPEPPTAEPSLRDLADQIQNFQFQFYKHINAHKKYYVKQNEGITKELRILHKRISQLSCQIDGIEWVEESTTAQESKGEQE